MSKVILITGGSRGLGAKFVERLAAYDDYQVYFTYHHSAENAAALSERFHNAVSVECDQKQEDDVIRCVDRIVSEQGKLDVLVNNACPSFRPHDFLDTDWSMFQEIMDVDVKGAYLFMKKCGQIMKAQGYGKIVNILSSYILNVPPNKLSFYITSKHALLGLSKAASAEFSKYGVTVNMISPGMMETDLTSYLPRKYFQMAVEKHPMKRMATTDDVADALDFLVSDKAQFINGVNIPVNGGETFLC